MKKIFLFLVALFATASVFAEPFSLSNFYIDGFGGCNFVNSFKEDDVRVDLDAGYAVGGALGYRFSRFFKIEGEAAYRFNTFDQMVIEDICLPASGSIKNVTGMANGIFEIPLLGRALLPYFGVGIGKSWSREHFQLEPIVTREGVYFFDKRLVSSCGFAGQGIAGVIFCAGQKIEAAVEYRYLDGAHIQGNHTIDLNLKRYF